MVWEETAPINACKIYACGKYSAHLGRVTSIGRRDIDVKSTQWEVAHRYAVQIYSVRVPKSQSFLEISFYTDRKCLIKFPGFQLSQLRFISNL